MDDTGLCSVVTEGGMGKVLEGTLAVVPTTVTTVVLDAKTWAGLETEAAAGNEACVTN